MPSVPWAGTAAAATIEGFCYVGMDAFSQASISFTGQNFGAKKYNRIDRIFLWSIVLGTSIGALFGGFSYLFGGSLLGIFSKKPGVIRIGMLRMGIICLTQFTCIWMHVPSNICRAMGKSLVPMLNTVGCVCVFRVIWICTVFAADWSLRTRFLSYPISWGPASAIGILYCFFVRRKVRRIGMPAAEEAMPGK